MATISNCNRFHFWYFILLGLITFGQAVTFAQTRTKSTASAKKPTPLVLPVYPVFSTEDQMRQAVYDSAARFIGRTERTNHNDADWIAAINRFSDLPAKSHYCASAFYYVHAVNGIRLKVAGQGMVRSYFSSSTKIVYKRNQRGNQRSKIKRMDAVSLFVSHIEGIAQDEFDPDEDSRVKLIGFNTTQGKGTKGGCYVNFRNTRDIKMIANWITPYFNSLNPAKK